MTAQLLVTMDDLETAVPLNAALEEAGYQTTLLSSLDDTRKTVRRVKPELVVLTGAVHEPRATLLAALAREQEISSIALLEATDSERARSQLGVTDMLVPLPWILRLAGQRGVEAIRIAEAFEARAPTTAGAFDLIKDTAARGLKTSQP